MDTELTFKYYINWFRYYDWCLNFMNRNNIK